MKEENAKVPGAPAQGETENTGGGLNERIVTIDTGSETEFEKFCEKIGYTVDFIEADSRMVETSVSVKHGHIQIVYSYLQGLRYGIQTALLNIEELEHIQILDIETRRVCTRENCNHETHLPVEPIRIKVKVIEGD